MSGLKGAECRKFQANIFNKSKCTNCFKQREEHSPEALESNRVSLRAEKGGVGISLWRKRAWIGSSARKEKKECDHVLLKAKKVYTVDEGVIERIK